MARAIPINQAGLRHAQHSHAQPYAAAWGIPQPAPTPVRPIGQSAPAPRPGAAEEDSWRSTGLFLLAVSFLSGALAMVCSLEVLPTLAASSMGLNQRGAFFLLVSGAYLVSTTLYAAWRTRLLQNLHYAPWDARLMVYANLGVGGVVSAAAGLLTLTVVGIILLLIAFIALLVSGTGNQSRPQ